MKHLILVLALVGCGGRVESVAPDHCEPIDAGNVPDSATAVDAGTDAACTPQYALCLGDCAALGDGNGETAACIATTCSCDMTSWF